MDEDTEIRLLSDELLECVYDDKLVHAKLLTQRLTPDERHAVVSRTVVDDGRSLLCVAIEQGRIPRL